MDAPGVDDWRHLCRPSSMAADIKRRVLMSSLKPWLFGARQRQLWRL
jgi:hypothetical protein